MKKKSIIIDVIILLAVSILTVFYLSKSEFNFDFSLLLNVKWYKYLILLVIPAIYIMADSFIISHSARRYNKSDGLFTGAGAYLYGSLGSSITPAKSGHFPFMLYYFNKKKYSLEQTIAIFINNQIVYSITLIILYLLFGIIGAVNGFSVMIGNVNFKVYLISFIGASTNTLYILACLFLSYNQKIQDIVINVEAFIKRKLKRIDDVDKFREEKHLKMKAFKEGFYSLCHNFKSYIPQFGAYFIFMILCYGLPYFAYLVITDGHFDFLTYVYYFSLTQSMSYVSNIIPVPGQTGVAEFSFLTVFSEAMGSNVSLILIIYRFLNYYFILLIDLIYFLIFTIKNNVEKKE